MSTTETITGTDPQVLADIDALTKHLMDRTPVEPALARRVQERAAKITEELRQKYGERSLAADLIRETRDEL